MPCVRNNKNMYETVSIIDNQDYYDETDDIIDEDEFGNGNYNGESFYEDGTSLEDYQGSDMLSSTIHRGFRTSCVDNMFSKPTRSSSIPTVLSVISTNTEQKEENVVDCKSQKKWGNVNKNITTSIDYKSYPILGYTPPSFKDGFTQVVYKKTTRVSTPKIAPYVPRVITRADMPKLVRQIGL